MISPGPKTHQMIEQSIVKNCATTPLQSSYLQALIINTYWIILAVKLNVAVRTLHLCIPFLPPLHMVVLVTEVDCITDIVALVIRSHLYTITGVFTFSSFELKEDLFTSPAFTSIHFTILEGG